MTRRDFVGCGFAAIPFFSFLNIRSESDFVEKIFPRLDRMLTDVMKAKLGDRFDTLADCYANGGLYGDIFVYRHRRLGVYAFVESDGKEVGAAVDVNIPKGHKHNLDDLPRLKKMFDDKYASCWTRRGTVKPLETAW